MGIVVIKQYIYQMYIPISASTFSISILLFLVISSLVLLDAYFSTVWMTTLGKEVMADPVLWTLSRVKIPFLSKCACLERFLIPEVGYLLTKRCILCSDNMRCRSDFLAFFLVSEKKQFDIHNTQPRLLTGRLGRKPMEQHEGCLTFSRLTLWIRNSTWLLTS